MGKRPFKKLKGVSPENDAYAIEHDRRTWVFNFTTEEGGTMVAQGNAAIKDCKRMHEILMELWNMRDK